MRLRGPALASLLAAVGCASCAPERLVGTFTSQVVQRETCRTVGDTPETCTRDEASFLLRVSLVEMADDRVFIHGVPNGAETDTSILGTRDAEGGFLFVAEQTQVNEATGCTLVETKELALSIDETAEKEAVGTDPCVPLLGREIVTTASSPECDDVHDPPQPIQRVNRRRWEKPVECEAG